MVSFDLDELKRRHGVAYATWHETILPGCAPRANVEYMELLASEAALSRAGYVARYTVDGPVYEEDER